MSKAPKDKDQEKGDEVLRRLLKTKPDHRKATPKAKGGDKKPPPRSAAKSEG